jgi:hypothetical protein
MAQLRLDFVRMSEDRPASSTDSDTTMDNPFAGPGPTMGAPDRP